jgi:hypothetical protein
LEEHSTDAFPGKGRLMPQERGASPAEAGERGSEGGPGDPKKNVGHFLKGTEMKYRFGLPLGS